MLKILNSMGLIFKIVLLIWKELRSIDVPFSSCYLSEILRLFFLIKIIIIIFRKQFLKYVPTAMLTYYIVNLLLCV